VRQEEVRLGVAGWPVAHSLSPAFQTAALQAAGLSGWSYGRLPIPPALFAETVRALPGTGYRGINVTIPHKAAALAVSGAASPRARAIGAANTLLFDAAADGWRIAAENTDAPGMLAALPVSPAGRRALVLGAGGSARAAVWALLGAGAEEVMVWNRDPVRAEALCAELGGRAVRRAAPAELLVHCTAVGLAPGTGFKDLPLDADDLSKYEILVDFVYRHEGSLLTQAARARSVETVDGLELLIAQGAISFELFTGAPAPLAAMREAVGLV
jgi:shikimate dehydrogenase